MSAPTALVERLLPAAPLSGEQAHLRAWLDAHGLPTTREEAWRYTPIADIHAALERADPPPLARRGVTRAVVDDLAGDHRGVRLVVVNGTLEAELSDLDRLPHGVSVRAAPPGPESPATDPSDGFDALNRLAAGHAATVDVAAGVQLDRPIHLVHLAAPGEAPTLVHPRTIVTLGRGSRAEVTDTFVGLDGSSITNASTSIVVDEDALLEYQRIQAEPHGAVHIGRTHITQRRGSTVRAGSIMSGASIARSAIEVRLAGTGAVVDLSGLYVAGDGQHHDNVITVDHAAPRCTSSQRFKGVIGGHGRGSFTGHVIVRPGAAGADAAQTNHNLLLAPTAQVDTRPWLEILTDEVRCVHGATVGRLDEDALFYLRSRGIPLDQSRALLVDAFAAEIIDAVTLPSLRDQLTAAFAACLGRLEP